MNDFDAMFASAHLPTLYATFGRDATVTRGAAAAVPTKTSNAATHVGRTSLRYQAAVATAASIANAPLSSSAGWRLRGDASTAARASGNSGGKRDWPKKAKALAAC